MMPRVLAQVLTVIGLTTLLGGCGAGRKATKQPDAPRTIAVTYQILGSVVQDLVGNAFQVYTVMPNGADVHEWEPSAKEIAALTHADLIVENGLGLEGGMAKSLDTARKAGVPFFTASDHIVVRHVGAGEGIPSDDPDQQAGAPDPHLWTDPMTVKAVVDALAADLKQRFGVDLGDRTADLDRRLTALDGEVRAKVAQLPPERRKLVTGHESLGYFAQRYQLKLVGAVIPSLTSEAESSAGSLGALKKLIRQNQVSVVFTELGTPARTVEVLAREAKVKTISLTTHTLPEGGDYFTFERNLADTLIGGLR